MNTRELPETYRGYSTAELLDILERIPGGRARNIPMQTMSVLDDFEREYELTYTAQRAAERSRTGEAKLNPA